MNKPADFARTLHTAKEQEQTAKLIERAEERARKTHAHDDAFKLHELARQYRDYAQTLREAVTAEETTADPDQAVLL